MATHYHYYIIEFERFPNDMRRLYDIYFQLMYALGRDPHTESLPCIDEVPPYLAQRYSRLLQAIRRLPSCPAMCKTIDELLLYQEKVNMNEEVKKAWFEQAMILAGATIAP